MYHELAILYAYCDLGTNRDTVRDFYSRFVRDNPGVPVIPLTVGYEKLVDGTVDVETLESVWPDQKECRCSRSSWLWAQCDRVYWRYLRSPDSVKAERYALFDWDSMSNGMAVREFFNTVYDAPYTGLTVFTHMNHPSWQWWTSPMINYVGEGYVRGIEPVTGTLISAKAVAPLLERPPDQLRMAFCEAHYPNILSKNGFFPEVNPRREMFGVCYAPRRPLGHSGIHHPVKYHGARYWPYLQFEGPPGSSPARAATPEAPLPETELHFKERPVNFRHLIQTAPGVCRLSQ